MTNTIMLSSQSNEWYTPREYIDAAREVMGAIDLDPASCEEANQQIKASRYYSIEDNGLEHPWHGRIWLNPPYGKLMGHKSNTAVWINHLLDQYERGHVSQAVLMVNHMTCAQWFQPLWQFPICFTDHRVNFYSKKVGGGPTQGAAFVYLGSQKERFIKLFLPFGPIVPAAILPSQRPLVALELWEEVAG